MNSFIRWITQQQRQQQRLLRILQLSMIMSLLLLLARAAVGGATTTTTTVASNGGRYRSQPQQQQQQLLQLLRGNRLLQPTFLHSTTTTATTTVTSTSTTTNNRRIAGRKPRYDSCCPHIRNHVARYHQYPWMLRRSQQKRTLAVATANWDDESQQQQPQYDHNNKNNNNNNHNMEESIWNHGQINYHRLDHIQRVYCISDLHTDHPDNVVWLRQQCRRFRRLQHIRTTKNTKKKNNVRQDDDDDDDDNTEKEDQEPTDLIVVAGDISHDLSTFQLTIQILQSQAKCPILFVPGNHEAWLSSSDAQPTTLQLLPPPPPQDSLQKLDQIYRLCQDMGVYTETLLIGATTSHPLWIIPLQSWYDGTLSLEGCDDLCRDFAFWPWVDFVRCVWPATSTTTIPPTLKSDHPRMPLGLNNFFLQRNQPMLQFVAQQVLNPTWNHTIVPTSPVTTTTDTTTPVADTSARVSSSLDPLSPPMSVLTVSHFLPNRQCLPDWKDVSSPHFLRSEWLDHGAAEISAKFAKVAGSMQIDHQIRSIFGHDHDDNDNDHDDNGTTASATQQATLTTTTSSTPPPRTSHSPSLLFRHIHVFGHSHRPKDFEYKGIRYIHNPLGKPRERQLHMVNPKVNFQLVWDVAQGGEVVATTPVIRYWEEHGGGKEALKRRMMMMKKKMSTTRTTPTQGPGSSSSTKPTLAFTSNASFNNKDNRRNPVFLQVGASSISDNHGRTASSSTTNNKENNNSNNNSSSSHQVPFRMGLYSNASTCTGIGTATMNATFMSTATTASRAALTASSATNKKNSSIDQA